MEQSCQVFTLGDTTAKEWRYIQGVGYLPLQFAVCINGDIYYKSTTKYDSNSGYTLMRFDVRSEKFYRVDDAPKRLMNCVDAYLINYQGKLGFVHCEQGVEIWVMETQGWSKIFSYEMEWFKEWRSVGVTRGGEIVFVMSVYFPHDMLRVLYYDPKQNSKRYVDLEGIFPKEFRCILIWTAPDYVENTMRLC